MNKVYVKCYFGLVAMIFSCVSVMAQPTFDWVLKWGGTDYDQSLAIAVDKEGNSYATGFYNGTGANFGSLSVTSAGSSDIALAKADASGNFVWVRNLGGNQSETGTKLAVDNRGNVYIAGGFSSSNFTPEGSAQSFAAQGWNHVFVAKYDDAGNFKWATTMGGSEGDYCEGLAVDEDGNVYLSGYFSSSDFDPGSSSNILSPVGGSDIFLVKLDSNGNYVWANSMGGSSDDYGRGLALDGRGHIYMTGFFNGTANFDPNGTANLAVAGVSDIFIAKYDTAGNYVWAKRMGGVDDDYGHDVSLDPQGDVFVVGAFSGIMNFDGTPIMLPSIGGRDAMVAKYDSAGNFEWARNIGGPGWDEGMSLKADGAGNVYVTGNFSDNVNLGNGVALSSLGIGDVFVAKYDGSGQCIWARNMGGTMYESGTGVGLDGSGNLYLTGHFMSDPADFNLGGANGQLSPASADGFIVKYSCADTSSSLLTIVECGAAYTVNGVEYTATGIYTQTLANAAGCDSVLTIDLTLNPIEIPIITVNEQVLIVQQTYDAYQWMDEDGDIQGATGRSYTVTANGKYSVRTVDANGCEATSSEYEVTNVSVNDLDLANLIRIYPNPTSDIIKIKSPSPVSATLGSLDGRILIYQDNADAIDVANLAAGVYLLQLSDSEGGIIMTERVMKK